MLQKQIRSSAGDLRRTCCCDNYVEKNVSFVETCINTTKKVQMQQKRVGVAETQSFTAKEKVCDSYATKVNRGEHSPLLTMVQLWKSFS